MVIMSIDDDGATSLRTEYPPVFSEPSAIFAAVWLILFSRGGSILTHRG